MAETATKLNKAGTKADVQQVRAAARYLRLSPRKARLVTNLVKNMYALEAVAQLQFVNKKAAGIVSDVIKSAIANGENNFKLKKENLFIQSITCDSGPRLKRYMPRAQGRATEIRRPLSHINVVLIEKENKRKRRAMNFSFGKSKEAKAKDEQGTKTAREDALEDKNIPAMRNQVDKTQQDVKKSTAQQKRRLFNRKSGV